MVEWLVRLAVELFKYLGILAVHMLLPIATGISL